MADDGVSWVIWQDDVIYSEIRAQRYDSAGQALGGELQVHAETYDSYRSGGGDRRRRQFRGRLGQLR